MSDAFPKFARWTARTVGHSSSFAAALGVVAVWATTGPFFHFSDTWQLVINTGTTIVTFLMVFLIQNTQNRDSHALHLKLDELIRANKHARNHLIALEELPQKELDALQKEFDEKSREVVERHRRKKRQSDASISSSRVSEDAE